MADFAPRFASHPDIDASAPVPGSWLDTYGRAAGFRPDRRFGPADRRETTAQLDRDESRKSAIEAARAEGFAAGHAAAAAEAAERDRAAQDLAASLGRIDRERAEQLSLGLRQTVALLCERTLAPLALDRDALARRASRAAATLAQHSARIAIHVHPEDLAAVRSALDPDIAVVADPECERGALRCEAAEGELLDGPQQWRAAIAAALDAD